MFKNHYHPIIPVSAHHLTINTSSKIHSEQLGVNDAIYVRKCVK
jgi:hypothetical protein